MRYMKCYRKFLMTAIALVFLVSCTDFSQLSYPLPAKPLSIAQADSLSLNGFGVLKSYIDTTKFKLGICVSAVDYNTKAITYKIANSNFNEINAGIDMKHGAVIGTGGVINLANVLPFVVNATNSGLSVFGHTLCASLDQNSTYLNSLIAPTVIPGGTPGYIPFWSQDFETDVATNYSTSATNAIKGFTAVGGGKGGVGRALTITNPAVQSADWGSQVFFTFPTAVKTGDRVRLTMDVKSDVNATYSTQAHVSPGNYQFYDFFGSVPSTTQWTTYVMELNPVSSSVVGCTTIAFNLGNTATTYYFDNAKVEIWNANTGSTVPKTDAQKTTIIDAALNSWISTIVVPCKNYVKAWDVVNEPISDTDPTLLKTGVGRTLAAGEFYWQDYLGKDYAVKAITYARQYGNASDKLFISDYGLETPAKCQGLITYINYLEGKGVKLDGIGAELHVTLGITSLDAIKAMFTTLANTGKLIKVSQLDMGINPAGTGANLLTTVVTFSQLKQMSDFYNQIVKAYIQLVPAAQRYGITQWALSDGQTGAAWRAGQPIGLWNSAANTSWITASPYSRKPAYAGFANALQGK